MYFMHIFIGVGWGLQFNNKYVLDHSYIGWLLSLIEMQFKYPSTGTAHESVNVRQLSGETQF